MVWGSRRLAIDHRWSVVSSHQLSPSPHHHIHPNQIRHRGDVQLIDASCGRCNFPLINSPMIDEPRLQQEDNTAIACKVCGMRHSIITGKVSRSASMPSSKHGSEHAGLVCVCVVLCEASTQAS